MSRKLEDVYVFITDRNNMYYRAIEDGRGNYTILKSGDPYPIKYRPVNLLEGDVEFATNSTYFSMARSINYPVEFIKDGAAILRHFYHNGKGTEEWVNVIVVEYNGRVHPNRYELSYKGRVDFTEKNENPKTASFTAPLVDSSAWGILSNNDNMEFEIDCSPSNPKAIPVLYDGITLVNRYTYQTVQAPITHNSAENTYTVPFVLVNQDGDSAGLLAKSQTLERYSNWFTEHQTTSKSFFLTTFYAIKDVEIDGSFMFEWSTNTMPSGGLILYFVTSLNQRFEIFPQQGNLVRGKIYTLNFNIKLDLAVGENIFFLAVLNDNAARNFTITPIVTNITVTTRTRQQPSIVWALRPLDLLQTIVSKATFGLFTMNSNFFTVNNKHVCLSGDSLRNIPHAKLYTNFKDFFITFNAINFMALRNINGDLWMEKATVVYSQNSTIIDLGETEDIELHPAVDFLCNEVACGCPSQDYRHPSGRLEVNTTNTWTLPMINTDSKLEIVTKYRLGCYDVEFMISDYKGSSTQDNTGDKSVYVLDITDEQGTAVDNIETFENINVNNAPLEPIIKSPLDNDIITFNRPTIKGIAPAGYTVNVYVDNQLDGTTVSDPTGHWIYNITNDLTAYNPNLGLTGLHSIEATYSDLSAPKTSVNIVIDTSFVQATELVYPSNNQSLYNNKPLIRGVAQNGTNINISLDGVFLGATVADASGNWEFKSPIIPNGKHVIDVNGIVSSNITVDTDVAFPLITYIDGELDGTVILNNLPLIEGVAKPGTTVTVWLNYIKYAPLGTALADTNGNWSLQVTPVNYNDALSGIPVILAPIINGLNIISTSLINHTVGINVTGYKLNRPNYVSITGVTDRTVFNTELSPKHMLKAHYPRFAAIFDKLPQEVMRFQKPDKNANQVTNLNGEITNERADITRAEMGAPIAVLEYAIIKTTTLNSFAKTLYNFNSGGIIRFKVRGVDVYGLPIGSMKMSSLISTQQQWKLLLSPLTTFQSLLNLYKHGQTIKIMEKSIYRSDYNSLHMVMYDFQQNPKYNFKTIYEDLFHGRNNGWSRNPRYVQKYQTTEVFTDQIISNGISNITLRVYRCYDASIVDVLNYQPVNPAPINAPDIVLETEINLSLYPPDIYFFVMFVGETPIAISERIHTKPKWNNTILLEASHSLDKTGCFFSTGFKTVIRVEGIIHKLQPDTKVNVAEDDGRNKRTLYGQIARKALIRFGTAYGLPDYIYLKIADAIVLDEVMIEKEYYDMEDGEQIEPADHFDGHPLYYYNVTMYPKENSKGMAVPAAEGADVNSVVLVIDAAAFGLPAGSIYNIKISD